MAEMTCKELVELVTEYFEEALPLGERMRFEEHLGNCRPCRRYLDQMRKTIRTVGRLEENHLSPQMQVTLLGVFRNWKQDS
jgi:predicted anti-sigma-YlaC factor YlaD